MNKCVAIRYPPLSGFLLPDNGETESGVRTFEVGKGLKGRCERASSRH